MPPMLFDDYWTQGLNQRQQQTIVDFMDNGQKYYKGMGGYKTIQYPKRFLKSKKGRDALIKYGEFLLDEKKGRIREHIARISYIRALYNPSDIIDMDGEFVLPKNAKQPVNTEEARSLKFLGPLAYCVEGVKTSYDRMGNKQVDIQLCKRKDDREVLEKIFDIYNPDTEDLTGGKPIFEMDDAERMAEIQEILNQNKILALAPPQEKIEGNIDEK